MNYVRYGMGVLGAAALVAAAMVPSFGSGYAMSLVISMLTFTALATAWALFSGPTGYVSLATVAFFGIGSYTAAVLNEVAAWPVVIVVAAAISLLVALVVGLATLRLRGVYFVIFTFGLSELIRQLVTWYEANYTGTIGRYIFLDITQEQIVWQLVAVTALVFIVGWLIGRSRLGLALRMMGDDEVVARHSGVDTTRARLIAFAISSVFMAVVGAIVSPRWTYIDPTIAFNPVISFQVLIMALLGGATRLYGPMLGAVPLVLLFEYLSANFPNYFSVLLGVTFMAIVYLVPNGVAGLIEGWATLRRKTNVEGGGP